MFNSLFKRLFLCDCCKTKFIIKNDFNYLEYTQNFLALVSFVFSKQTSMYGKKSRTKTTIYSNEKKERKIFEHEQII